MYGTSPRVMIELSHGSPGESRPHLAQAAPLCRDLLFDLERRDVGWIFCALMSEDERGHVVDALQGSCEAIPVALDRGERGGVDHAGVVDVSFSEGDGGHVAA